jgi:hypothetical protein
LEGALVSHTQHSSTADGRQQVTACNEVAVRQAGTVSGALLLATQIGAMVDGGLQFRGSA